MTRKIFPVQTNSVNFSSCLTTSTTSITCTQAEDGVSFLPAAHQQLLLAEVLQQDLGTFVVAEAADLRLDGVQHCLHLGAHRLVAAVQETLK